MQDSNCKWYIDYNMEHIDIELNLPIGTLRIPPFLIHDNKKVCSRGVLQKAVLEKNSWNNKNLLREKFNIASKYRGKSRNGP